MTGIFYDADADPGRLEERAVAVVGYGNQGRIQTLNMRDSGVENVIVGNVRDESWEQAEEDGFELTLITDAVAAADTVFILIPDEVAPTAYREHVEPALGLGKTLA